MFGEDRVGFREIIGTILFGHYHKVVWALAQAWYTHTISLFSEYLLPPLLYF